MTDLPTFVLERTFDAPIELVWRTWTEPELLARWYGPGVETIVHQFDPKPGGLWLGEMKWGDNSNYQRVEFTEVEPPSKLVWLHSVSDKAWKIIANPRMPDWPMILLTTVLFEADGSQTKMRLTWAPHEATEAEINCFAAALPGLNKGWGAGMDLLAQLLEEMQAGASA